MRIIPSSWLSTLAGLALFGGAVSQAGTYKPILIDGSFEDWAGVPVAFTDEEDAIGSFDFKEVQVANDENFLYVRATLYAAADYARFHHHIVIDGDNDPGTGYSWVGVGSELLIEDGSGYQQMSGNFNAGAAAGLDWATAPVGTITQFEARMSRSAVGADQLPIFTQGAIALGLEVLDLNWATKDQAPGIPYEFADKPPEATGTRTLVNLTTTSWRYSDSGTDWGTEWRVPEFDDALAGWSDGAGLFGYGAAAGVYPAPIQTPFANGWTTYYLRVPFTWDFAPTGVALVATNYLSDGAAIYLNGAAVKTIRLPAGEPAYATPATGGPASPGLAEVVSLPASALVVGQNVLAVEVHQAVATPTELVFGFSLTATDSLPPVIEDPTQPADRTVLEGEATTFSPGTVLGSPPLAYQWLKNGSPIPGATNPSYVIPQVLFADAGSYAVEITNLKGQQTTSRAAELATTATPVSFTDAGLPADLTVTQGRSAVFAVAVAGSPLLDYQWLRNGAAIPDATNAQFTIPAVELGDAGRYSVTVGNRLNSVTSREAPLTVTADSSGPAIAAVVGSATKIELTFSEPVDEASANQAANYQVAAGLVVQSATRDGSDPRRVTLATSQQAFGTVYTLTVNGVKDLYGNATVASAPFRSTIVIDGDLADWSGISPLQSEPQDTPEGIEFKDFYVANDDEFLYVRFSFHAPVGPLPVNHYYHINLDTDNDPATGHSAGGIGVEVMIENGAGYQQKNGGFNEGAVNGLDVVLAPGEVASDFECRISRAAVYDSDSERVFTGDSVALTFELISSGWSLLELAPQGGVAYDFVTLPPMTPGPLSVRLVSGQVEINWPGAGTLESRESLTSGNWAPVPGASKPYVTSPARPQVYYRLRN